MKEVLLDLASAACALLAVLAVFHCLGTPKRAPTPPPVDRSIPYCWSQQHELYFPCMYSSKERNA